MYEKHEKKECGMLSNDICGTRSAVEMWQCESDNTLKAAGTSLCPFHRPSRDILATTLSRADLLSPSKTIFGDGIP